MKNEVNYGWIPHGFQRLAMALITGVLVALSPRAVAHVDEMDECVVCYDETTERILVTVPGGSDYVARASVTAGDGYQTQWIPGYYSIFGGDDDWYVEWITLTHREDEVSPVGIYCHSHFDPPLSAENLPAPCRFDSDGDDVLDHEDNCPNTPNPDQADADGDGIGDACDDCPFDPFNDADGDGVCGDLDNCPDTHNPGQEDADGDGIGDACDDCPFDPFNDADGDGVCGDLDNCPDTHNPGQEDADGDGIGDACDDCPFDPFNDADGDGVCGDLDNCPDTHNPGQEDVDNDGLGDACDDCPNDPDNDADGDGLCGDVDGCPNSILTGTILYGLSDTGVENILFDDGCSTADLFQQVLEAAEASNPKNHGQFVSRVAKGLNLLIDLGLLTEAEHEAIMEVVAQGQ